MSLSITNAKLLNYNYKTNFYGEYKFGYIQNYDVEGEIFSTITNLNTNKSSNFEEFKDYILNLKEDTEISINGKNFGKGRIISISNAGNQNQSIAVKYNVSFEIYGPTNSITIDGITISNSNLIEEFSEDFNFKLNDDGFKECTHALNIKYRDESAGSTDPDSSTGSIKKAKNLASLIFNASINFNFLNSVFNDLKTTTAKPYYKETYDLISHSCSFEKNFKIIIDNQVNNVSHEYQHSFNLNEAGIITVTEKGKIQGLGSTIATCLTNAQNQLSSIISNSYSKCNTIFNAYKNSNSLTNPDSLLASYISLRKDYDTFEGNIEYEIVYTNNQKYFDTGYRHEYENVFNKDSADIITVQRNGTYKKIGTDKDINFNQRSQLIAKINASLNGASENLQNLYTNSGGIKTLYLLNKTLNYPSYGNEMTYSISYSDSEEYNVPNTLQAYFTNISLNYNDVAPSHIYNEYTILGVKRFLSAGNQTTLGKRIINFTGTLKKTNSNVFSVNLLNTTMLSAVKTYVISKAVENLPENILKIIDAYIVAVDYSADSRYIFQFNLELAYTSIISQEADIEERVLSK